MRIISGICKGKRLKAVPGESTRPTTDKMKETIFNLIGPYFDGGLGLDLFAGSGGVGLEGLSRGLDKVIFVDSDKFAIQTIKKNIEICGLKEQCEVYKNDAGRALKAFAKRSERCHFIFLDPPYKKQKLIDLLTMIDQRKVLASSGIIVCEHSSGVILPTNIGSLDQYKSNNYGTSSLTLYKRRGYLND